MIIIATFTKPIVAANLPIYDLNSSGQLLLVMTKDWDAVNGKMQRYQRDPKNHQWDPIGESIPVVVGRHGMGWSTELADQALAGPIKKEGDGRTPAGIFALGPAFGFEKPAIQITNFPYLPLKDTTVCVDDSHSKFYNQIVDSNMVASDWNSGEQMRQVPQYNNGVVVQYNTKQPIRGGGSCIFMHIWKGPDQGTAGCIAMETSHIQEVVAWLDDKNKPIVVTLPQSAYQQLQKKWQLPIL